jgi:hypothetical protein
VFRRGGVLVELARDDDGRAFIAPMDNARVRGTLARVCVFWRERKGKQHTERFIVSPPETVVCDFRAYLDRRVRVLGRVVHTPVFGPAGELLAGPGYHAAARIYHDPHPDIPAIPDAAPTPEEVEQARTLIMEELLGDFPFVDQADKAHAVALLLLPFVRAMIPGPTPLHMIEAPTMGSGKGLLADVLTSEITGARIGTITEARDDEEWRKRITSTLIGAPTHIMLDNINRPIEGGALAAVLTATIWEDRLLGFSQNVRLPVSSVWLATSNNPTMSSEMARRTVRIRIDPRIDRPWLRTGFKHENLREWVRENRGVLVAACITLIRAGLSAGTPGQTLGSFEHWSSVMGRILSGIGIPGFLGNLVKLYDAADTEGQRWRAVVEVWREAHGSKRVKAADVYRVVTGAGIDMELRGSTERALQTEFGRALAKMKDRVIGGYQIVHAGTHKRAAEWRLKATDGGNEDPETEDMFSNGGPAPCEGGEHSEHSEPFGSHSRAYEIARARVSSSPVSKSSLCSPGSPNKPAAEQPHTTDELKGQSEPPPGEEQHRCSESLDDATPPPDGGAGTGAAAPHDADEQSTDLPLHDQALLAATPTEGATEHIAEARRQWDAGNSTHASAYLMRSLAGVGIGAAIHQWVEAEKRVRLNLHGEQWQHAQQRE